MKIAEIIDKAFAILGQWPLVQGSVAILVLVIAALLAWATLRKQLPGSGNHASQLPQVLPPVPVQIESPWLVQHLIDIHQAVQNIERKQDEANARLNTLHAALTAIAKLLRRRADRQRKN